MAQLPDWWDRVDKIFAQKGVPTRVWTAISYAESSFVPWAANTRDPNGGSYGLFALNLGGQGKGYQVNYLKDPINNAMIASGPIANAVKRCGPDNISCIAVWSGHPVENGQIPAGNPLVSTITRLWQYAKNLDGQEIYDSFTSGHGIPTDPGYVPTPSDPASGIKETFNSIIHSITSVGATAAINMLAPTVMGFVGINLIAVGIILAALKSPPGKVVINTASAMPGTAGTVGRVTSVVSGQSTASPIRTARPKAPAKVAVPKAPPAPASASSVKVKAPARIARNRRQNLKVLAGTP